MTDDDGAGLEVLAGETAKLRMAQVTAQESADATKAEAEYRDEPKGNEQCSRCAMFVEGGYCSKVAAMPTDLISPRGWCRFFASDDVGEIDDLDELDAVLATDASGNQVEEENGEWVAYLDGRRFGGFPNRATAAAWLEHFGPRRS